MQHRSDSIDDICLTQLELRETGSWEKLVWVSIIGSDVEPREVCNNLHICAFTCETSKFESLGLIERPLGTAGWLAIDPMFASSLERQIRDRGQIWKHQSWSSFNASPAS